ncbi:hypothetical protein HOT94_gp102 [Gordonia phage Phistory]|uniref:Uncharacterized protein n=1 Tax=Gordonia phage Phistory TaxID=2301694 RepID=A0A385E1M5_9CAUD|nr:hypothetical protein HOT94_gp102 [Gordonia phage Phistory]AXQ64807.1 hypothetical protein SEA_PHISTORY_102 [Gordonia phage Phistory]
MVRWCRSRSVPKAPSGFAISRASRYRDGAERDRAGSQRQ